MNNLWLPTAEIETLKLRARILQSIRVFFAERNVTEVQVPSITTSSVTEVHIDSIPLEIQSGIAFLHTSPEYPMKRLLAAGMSDCYYMGSVFRQGECGDRHNPEFTMLEWYRLNYSLEQLSEEVAELVQRVLATDVDVLTISYADAVAKYTGIDIFNTNFSEIEFVLKAHSIAVADNMGEDLDIYLDLLMSTLVFPNLCDAATQIKQITIINNYPATQAALARIRSDSRGHNVAARFEVFVDGLEIANGYHEIQDVAILEQRFIEDNKRRVRLGKREMPIDAYLLSAMENGLPDCTGVALGIDRLIMLALNKQDIKEVIAFPQERC